MCHLPFFFINTPHIVHRATHAKLVESHSILMHAFAEATQRAKDHASHPDPSHDSALALHGVSAGREEQRTDRLHPYVKANFPDIRYWTRNEWLHFRNNKKDSNVLGSEAGPQGGTRCAQGENVSMQYLEHPDGEAVDGRLAAGI